ncbi:MAG: hypothetical protein IJ068_07240 [Bacilli bacterium]|nr:hypothetical protein [Bacilli bacterium]
MENEKSKKINKRWISIILMGIAIILFSLAFMMSLQNKNNVSKSDSKENEYNYTAYVKINPSIKLEYVQKCIDNNCNDPFVTNYELINQDAKDLFQDINLLENQNNLKDVIHLICTTLKEKNIEFSDVEVYSDWNGIVDYLKNEEDNSYTYTTSIIEKDVINSIINEKEDSLEMQKENNNISNNEESISSNSNSKEEIIVKNNYTIYLSDGVKFTMGGEAYCCTECITDDLIQEFKKAKGYKVVSSNSSQIDFRKVTNLSEPYSSATYFGENLVSKLTDLGAQNCAGLGSGPEDLTKDICSEYNLICE